MSNKRAEMIMCANEVSDYIQYRITFSEPVEMRLNRHRTAAKREATVKLFESRWGDLCYTFRSRSGYEFDENLAAKITGIEAVTREIALESDKVKVQKLANSIHSNAWPELRNRLQQHPDEYATGLTLNRVSMRQVFGDHVVKQLEEAFEKGEDFSYFKAGERRDRRVEVRRQPDGTVNAWYSSEYADCGNGDYYILLNPYSASFGEND